MAQFVNAMAYQLQLWDHHHGTGDDSDWQYYQDMAWGGMADYSNPNDSNNSLFYKEFVIITAGCSPAPDIYTTGMTIQEINFKDLPAQISNNFNDEHYFVQKNEKSLLNPAPIPQKKAEIRRHCR